MFTEEQIKLIESLDKKYQKILMKLIYNKVFMQWLKDNKVEDKMQKDK